MQCKQCRGTKKVQGMGGIYEKCKACSVKVEQAANDVVRRGRPKKEQVA